MLIMKESMGAYLAHSYYIDWEDRDILQKAKELKEMCEDEVDLVRKTYHFVRDEINHSWDVQDKRVTKKASEVLREQVGICWAKATLLAALLRANDIPTGICYQKLILTETPERTYCIHALNAVYMKSLDKWIRLDARGNNEEVHAEMDLTQEKLAFPVRCALGEIDYPHIYAEPLKITTDVLERSEDALQMYLHELPSQIG